MPGSLEVSNCVVFTEPSVDVISATSHGWTVASPETRRSTAPSPCLWRRCPWRGRGGRLRTSSVNVFCYERTCGERKEDVAGRGREREEGRKIDGVGGRRLEKAPAASPSLSFS